MRVDDIPDRFVGPGANGGQELPSFANAAAGIDHGDRIRADDKADIGDRALVLARHQGDRADVDEDTRRDFRDGQFRLLGTRKRQNDGRDQGEQREAIIHHPFV